MFSQSADKPAADESPAPVGMRELPPQPAKPVMPAYTINPPQPADDDAGPGTDDSVIAKDDHFDGTFTSRGTVVVMGSVKGRIEAVQVRIEDGAKVDADVIVDEAIIAGEFTGNLTCRERLEARSSGRINGRVETFKLMLHEGASVEGEMHMLTESPTDASETIRGTAPVRGEGKDSKAKPEAKSGSAAPAPRSSAPGSTPAVKPSSTAKPSTPAVGTPTGSSADTTPAPRIEAAPAPRRETVAETLRAETLRVAPRTSTLSTTRKTASTPGNGARGRSTTTTTGF